MGTIERHRFECRATVAEQIIALPVREGQAVRAGELLAQLDGSALAASRAVAAAQVEQWRQRLEELRHGARREEMAAAPGATRRGHCAARSGQQGLRSRDAAARRVA